MVRIIAARYRPLLVLCAGVVLFFLSKWIIDGAWFTADMITFTSAVENLYGRAQRAGELPVWAPEMQGGYPIFANGQVHFFYPPHFLLRFFFPGSVLLNVSLLLHALLGTIGMIALLRTYRLSWMAASTGGLMFVFGGAFSARFALTNFVLPLAWTPLLIFLLYRWWHGRSHAVLLAWITASACQILAGHPHAVLIGMATEALWLILNVLRGGVTVRHIIELVLASMLVIGLTLPETLPPLVITRETDRAGGLPTKELLEFSIPPRAYAGLVRPHPFGHGETYAGPKGEAEMDVYVGAGALLASLTAFIVLRRRLPVLGWFALGLTIIGGTLALGEYFPPYHWLVANTPQRYFATPARYFLFAHMGIAILTALGIDILRRFPLRDRWIIRTRDALLLLVVLGPVIWHAWAWEPGKPWSTLTTPPLVDTLRQRGGDMRIYAQANLGDLAPHNNFGLGIGDLLRDDRVYRQTFRAPFDTIAQVGIRVARGSPAAVAPVRLRLATHSGEQERTIEIPADRLVDSEWTFVELPIFWNVKDVEMILDLSLVSPTRAGPRLYIHRNPSGSDADPTGMLSVCRGENCTPVTADTRTTDMAFTVLPESKPVSWPHELLGPNIAAGYGIGSAQYTGALSLPAPSILLRNLEKNGASAFVSRERHLLDRFPITHVIGRFPPHRTLIEASDDFREITVLERDNAFIRVYENMHAFPRLHFARQVRAGGTDADQQYALLRTLDGVPARETVVANMTADEKYEAGGTIETLQDTRRTMTLRTDRGTEGFLVLRDLFFPGWSAEIDKQPTSILRTDVLWRGLIVPAGVHTVTFRYRLPHEQLLWTCAIGSGSVIVAWGLCLYTQRIIHRRES